MSATTYTVTCKNTTTDSVWTFAAFITLPDAEGCQCLAWQVTTVAPSGTGTLTWTTDADICLGSVLGTPPPVVYQGAQCLPAANGASWTVVTNSGIPVLQASNTPPLTPGTIQVTNTTALPVNVAYGQANAIAVVQPGLLGGETTAFVPAPSYWLYVATSVKAGQVIETQPAAAKVRASRVFLLPQALMFPPNLTTATATLSSSGSLSLSITYEPA